MMDDQFIQQFTGSASANIVTLIVFSFVMLVKKCIERNKHSECRSCCISFEIDNKTIRNDGEKPSIEEDDQSLRKLHKKHNRRLRAESV